MPVSYLIVKTVDTIPYFDKPLRKASTLPISSVGAYSGQDCLKNHMQMFDGYTSILKSIDLEKCAGPRQMEYEEHLYHC